MTIRSLSQAYLPHRTGSSRPARPAQISDCAQLRLSGGIDPQKISEMSHETASVLLNRVHHSQDPALVQRVLTIVDTEGIDIIAELWSESEPESLPGILWRLYTLRSWMRARKNDLPRFWTLGEPAEGAASAITGVSEFPTASDIVRTANSILSGAFTGDFAIALERASAFLDVIAAGMERQSQRLRTHLELVGNDAEQTAGQISDRGRQVSGGTANQTPPKSSARRSAIAQEIARLHRTSVNLNETARRFHVGANLWSRGKLN
ncbi:MAG: thymidine phosphorylase [Bifidobacteriaceae bacterium]|nr:thymidine phosphorylase [Bifidobacteriaceae bacterium]